MLSKLIVSAIYSAGFCVLNHFKKQLCFFDVGQGCSKQDSQKDQIYSEGVELALILASEFLSFSEKTLILKVNKYLQQEISISILEVNYSSHIKKYMENLKLCSAQRNLIKVIYMDVRPIAINFKNAQRVDISAGNSFRSLSGILVCTKNMVMLNDLKHLRHLKMDNCSLLDDEINSLKTLSNLESLSLINTRVSGLDCIPTQKLKCLNLSFTSVSDLSELVNFRELETLDISSTHVLDLEPMKYIGYHLRHLAISSSRVRSIEPLSECHELVSLKMNNTKVGSVSPLQFCTKLEELHLMRTPIQDIAGLSKCCNLRHVFLDSTRISDATPLLSNKLIQHLSLGFTMVSDISGLDCPNLRLLNLFDTKVSDVSCLKNCPRLQALNIDYTDVSNVSHLKSCKELEVVNLFDTKVGDICSLMHVKSVSGFGLGSKSPCSSVVFPQ